MLGKLGQGSRYDPETWRGLRLKPGPKSVGQTWKPAARVKGGVRAKRAEASTKGENCGQSSTCKAWAYLQGQKGATNSALKASRA